MLPSSSALCKITFPHHGQGWWGKLILQVEGLGIWFGREDRGLELLGRVTMEKPVSSPVLYLSIDLVQILPVGVLIPGDRTSLFVLWEYRGLKLSPWLEGWCLISWDCLPCHTVWVWEFRVLPSPLWVPVTESELGRVSRAVVPEYLACTSQKHRKNPLLLGGLVHDSSAFVLPSCFTSLSY